MPAYGNALNPSETTALVRFLTTLRGNDLAARHRRIAAAWLPSAELIPQPSSGH